MANCDRVCGTASRTVRGALAIGFPTSQEIPFVPEGRRKLAGGGAGEARATKQNVFDAIDQYLAPRVQPGHEIIIFLAGHGIVDGVGAQAKSYFLPVDTDIQSKETVARTAIDMEELISKLSALKASQFTLFYDACREDPSPGRGFIGNPLTDVTATDY